MHKIALFDIDKTLIRTDSMIQFVWYGLRKRPWTAYHLASVGLMTALYLLRLVRAERVKASYFYAIRFMEEPELEHFYDTVLAPKLYREALEELAQKKEQGCHVLLVTASPHAYMKYFRKLPWVDGVIGTDLVRRGGRYTNRIEGANCKGAEKTVRIERYLKEAGLVLDYEQSSAYSDSLSDLPMFGLVKNRILVNGRGPGLEERRWRS